MDYEEKKLSIDDLPDEDKVELKPVSPPHQNKIKKEIDLRLTKLKKLEVHEQERVMGQKWYFDRPERSWSWAFAVIALFVLEKLDLYDRVVAEQKTFEDLTMGFGGVFTDLILMATFIVKHPFYLFPLIPIIFKFKRPSDYFFELSFDGIHTVESLRPRKGQMVSRVKIKWAEIVEVNKTKSLEREMLELYSPNGKVGELIWDLEVQKKNAIKQLVKGLLLPNNSFRAFIEKEVM